jgi:hypothetical protein
MVYEKEETPLVLKNLRIEEDEEPNKKLDEINNSAV